MSYQKTIWVPGETKISAENMNNIESGIEENSLKLDELQNEIPTNVSDLNNDLGFISEDTATETFQQKITEDEKLNADLVSTENSTNKFVTNQDIDNWNSKQDAMQPGVDYATPGSVDETVATKQDKFATVFKPSPTLNRLVLEKDTFVTGTATFSDPTTFLSSINLSGSKIQSVADPTNDSDAATKKYVDEHGGGGGSLDVQINGESIVQDGVANIPYPAYSVAGVVKIRNSLGLGVGNDGAAYVEYSTNSDISNRSSNFKPITPRNLDFAVKSAICDGVGAAWTDAEKIAAQNRIGVAEKSFELIENYTMTETAIFSRQYEPDSTPYNFKALLVYITNNTESNLVVSLVLNTEGVTYTSVAAGATSPSLFIVYGNRLIPVSLTTAARDSGARNPYSPRQRAIGMVVNSITSIKTDSALPTGTNISIYGVRA